MSKSNYEIYAEDKQKRLLNKQIPLGLAICVIQDLKKNFSKSFIENCIDFTATLYGITYEELRNAVDNKEFWCV
jgi:hypothetical protein